MRYHKFDLVISLNRLSDIRKRRFIVKRHPIILHVRILRFSLNIFYCRKGTLQSNNTITQSNRIRTKAGSLYSSSPDHE